MHNLIKILHDKVFLNEVVFFYKVSQIEMNFLNYSIMFFIIIQLYLQSQFIRFSD